METPKEAAFLLLTKVVLDPEMPTSNRGVVEEVLAGYYPQYKMTDTKLEKIQTAYAKEVARILKMYSNYLKGRGIK